MGAEEVPQSSDPGWIDPGCFVAQGGFVALRRGNRAGRTDRYSVERGFDVAGRDMV